MTMLALVGPTVAAILGEGVDVTSISRNPQDAVGIWEPCLCLGSVDGIPVAILCNNGGDPIVLLRGSAAVTSDVNRPIITIHMNDTEVENAEDLQIDLMFDQLGWMIDSFGTNFMPMMSHIPSGYFELGTDCITSITIEHFGSEYDAEEVVAA